MAASNVSTETAVANLALQRIGEGSITTLSGTGVSAVAANLFFADTRDEVSRLLPWACLTNRTTLTTTGASAISGWTYYHTFDDTYLRILGLTDTNQTPNIKYRIEGLRLYHNLASGFVRYVKKETTITTWDALLLSSIECRLASKIAYKITGKEELGLVLQQEYVTLLSLAVQVGAVESHEDNDAILQILRDQLSQETLRRKPGIME
jgi:hypothetical protein